MTPAAAGSLSPIMEKKILLSLHDRKDVQGRFWDLLRQPVFALSMMFLMIVSLFVLFLHRDETVGIVSINAEASRMRGDRLVVVPSDTVASLEKKDHYQVVFAAASSFKAERKSDRTSITLESGKGSFSVEKRGEEFKVQTANAEVRVVGTKFHVAYDRKSGRTDVKVDEGRVEVSSMQGVKVLLHPGQSCFLLREESIQMLKSDPAIPRKGIDKTVEKMYLRDGSVLIGYTIKQTESETVFETSAGPITVKNSDIDRLEFIR